MRLPLKGLDMSEWYEAKATDIDLDLSRKEVDIFPNRERIEAKKAKVNTFAAKSESLGMVAPVTPDDTAKAFIDAVPSNWCASLLTGPCSALGAPPYSCPDIERLLNAIRNRMMKLAYNAGQAIDACEHDRIRL